MKTIIKNRFQRNKISEMMLTATCTLPRFVIIELQLHNGISNKCKADMIYGDYKYVLMPSSVGIISNSRTYNLTWQGTSTMEIRYPRRQMCINSS
jgi:hypothetical protein